MVILVMVQLEGSLEFEAKTFDKLVSVALPFIPF